MAALSAAARHHRARVAALSRDRAPDDTELTAARQGLAYEQLADHASRVVATWPDPPPEVLAKVAAILTAGGAV
jgi:hypothetical protein